MIGLVIVENIKEAIHDFIRSFLITLDKIVYWFVEQVLQLIVDLANVNIFSDTTINAFARRIYVILGLVMVFKLMISFIQILIDPDAMSDKEKGVGNVLKRVVIAMVLIVLVPSIFKMARDVQGYILPIIPKVILGINSDNDVTGPITEHNIGNVMAWYSFLPFFDYVNDTCAATGTIQKAVDGNTGSYEIYSVSTAADHINDKDSCNNGSYMYDHRYLISTLVGAYLLFSLVQVAINVAIRAIKFGICEFVAPIPIASYIDPKTSKSTFDKWLNTSIKVYLDLFIQLISIYFVVFVFMVVFKKENIGAILENVGDDTWRAILVILFIIVGLLKFVKEFPKFLSELLGLKTDGAIGSIFKGAWEGARGTVGFAKNLVKAPISNVSQLNRTTYSDGSKPSTLRKVGSAVGGVGGVVGNTLRGVASGKTGKDLTKYTFDRLTSNRDARIDRKNRRVSGYSWGQEKKEEYLQKMHISGKDSWAVEEYNEYDKMASLMSEAGALGLKKGEEQKHKITTTFNGQTLSYTDLETIAASNNGDTFDDASRGIHWNIDSGMISRARGAILDLQKRNKTENFAKLLRGSNPDAGAVQIHNKIVDHVKNSPAFTQQKTIDAFADKLFNTTRDNLGRITSSTPLTFVNSSGATVTYDANNFDYTKLLEIVSDREIFGNNDVQIAFKNASETMRNVAQTEQYAAERREKARNEARKAREQK